MMHAITSNAANDGDIDAEKTLIKIDELLDYDHPNYFVIRGDVNANIQAAEFGDAVLQQYSKRKKGNSEKELPFKQIITKFLVLA